MNSSHYISKLLGLPIFTTEGKKIGHVADIVLTHEAPHKIVGLLYGEGGWQYRLHLLNPFAKVDHSPTQPGMIPWDKVERIERAKVLLRHTKDV
jgi:sporulation protein YlmC with PRC-barrel domain